MRDTFSDYHPIVNFVYFTQVLVFSMFFMHPVCLGISLISAFTYSIYLNGKKALKFNFKYMLPMLIITALINPAFNHEGATILTYLRDGNPLTLESITYGIAAAIMFVTIISWFSCYNTVMTSDKFVYLFGRIIPGLSLILSMTLRFVPRFKVQLKIGSNAQKCIGRDVSNGSIIQRAKHGMRILSIMVTWALENAIEIADSMRSRGYGLPGRTAFSIYRFDKRDKYALIFLLFFGGYILIGYITKGLYWKYFPTMRGVRFEPYSMSLYISYLALCLAPVAINIKEDWKWKAIESKI